MMMNIHPKRILKNNKVIPKTLIVILGPTASGKTSLSIKLAKHYHCPILSADSRQFYKEMNIGTAKPTADEMQDVPHYFINSLSITEDYNVGKFENDAITLLEELFKTNNQVIMAGGSGLYIDAVCKGFDELPEADDAIRKQINYLYESEGLSGLQNKLKELDMDYYSQVDINNKQRLSRAIEVCLSTGRPYSEFRKGKVNTRSFDIIKAGLDLEREELYTRINARVDEMMKNGLLEEVKSLSEHKHLNALQTVGYKELFDYIETKTTLEKAIDLIKQNTRRFAKRQLTWFRKDEEIKWFAPDDLESVISYLNIQE